MQNFGITLHGRLRGIALGIGVTVASLCSIGIIQSQAATVNDLPFYGYDQLPAQLQADIEKALEQVPTEVAWDYNLSGGHITYQTKDLYHNGESNPYANGVYYLDSHDIYIKFSYDLEDRNRPRPELALTHELGHYMYYKTAYQWTDEMKQALDDAYQYWSKYAPEVTSKEEAFAFIYSEKCCCGPQFCDAEQVKLVQQVEQMFGVAVEG